MTDLADTARGDVLEQWEVVPVSDDAYGPVESNNPTYWRTLNEMGKRGELPKRIWPKAKNSE